MALAVTQMPLCVFQSWSSVHKVHEAAPERPSRPRPGKTVNIDLSGEGACCTNTTDCKILENKPGLSIGLAPAYGASLLGARDTHFSI